MLLYDNISCDIDLFVFDLQYKAELWNYSFKFCFLTVFSILSWKQNNE